MIIDNANFNYSHQPLHLNTENKYFKKNAGQHPYQVVCQSVLIRKFYLNLRFILFFQTKMYRPLFLVVAAVFMCFSCAGAEKKEIKASEIIKLIKKGKPVQIVDKIILDDLDFTADSKPFILNAGNLQNEINANIFFTNCLFTGKVSSNSKSKALPMHTVFRKNLVFADCDFRGEVDFEGAIVFGMVNFSKSVFREKANFNNLSVWAKDSYFSEMTAEKDFSFIYTSFSGNLYFRDASFNGKTSFQESSVKGKLSFNNSVFKEKAGFDLMEICGGAFFNYTVFEKNADFSFSRFLSTAEFVSADFKETGNFEKTFFLRTVRFVEVDKNNLMFTDTYFGN